MNIIRRNNKEIAEQLTTIGQKDIIEVMLHCDYIISEYEFTFNLIRSLIEAMKQEGDFLTEKEIWEQIDKAEIFRIHEQDN